MRGVLRHCAHGRLLAGAGKAGVVDEVPDLVCDGQGRPKAVLSDADRKSGYCCRGRACNRSPRPTPPVYPVGCRAHTLRRQQLSRAARHAAAPLDLQVKRVRHRRTLRRRLHPAQGRILIHERALQLLLARGAGVVLKAGIDSRIPDMCLASALDEVTSALQLRRFGCNRFPRPGWLGLPVTDR